MVIPATIKIKIKKKAHRNRTSIIFGVRPTIIKLSLLHNDYIAWDSYTGFMDLGFLNLKNRPLGRIILTNIKCYNKY